MQRSDQGDDTLAAVDMASPRASRRAARVKARACYCRPSAGAAALSW